MDSDSIKSFNLSFKNLESDTDGNMTTFYTSSLNYKYRNQNEMTTNFGTEHPIQFVRSNHSKWCDAFSTSIVNMNAKQAWKNGTKKIAQTLSSVQNTFGTITKKIKRSKQRKPLINLDSPSPVTPYTKSKIALGRTPTKLYSPFGIDTPKKKENLLNRNKKGTNSPKSQFKSARRKLQQTAIESRQKTVSSNLINDHIII